MKNRNSIDMINGPLLKNIIIFSLPLIASNALQILFNAADTIVVGKFAGDEALAAVSNTWCDLHVFPNFLGYHFNYWNNSVD